MNLPEVYAKNNDVQIEANSFLLEKYLKNVKFKNDKLSILDVGSGDGYALTNLLMKRIPKECQEVVGTDISKNMVEYANIWYGNSNVKFLQMDISNEDYPEDFCRRFDHCFSFLCLHFVINKRAAYENLFNMLKPDGDFLGWYLNNICIFDTYIKLWQYPEWNKFYPKDFIEHLKNFGNKQKSKTEIVLKEIGFKNCFVEIEKMQYEWESIDKYKEFLISVNPIMSNLQELEKEKHIQDCLNELRLTKGVKFVSNGEEEKVLLDYELLIVYASKK